MERRIVSERRILVVEDDPSARTSMALLLKIDRHQVTEAANGCDALDLVKRQNFDLVILDFAMPKMLGGEVALRMKLIAPMMPVLMVTAYLEKLAASDKPVDAVLGKPFTVDELRDTVARLVHG